MRFAVSDGCGGTTCGEAVEVMGTDIRYFALGVNAIELADTATATFIYGDSLKIGKEFSAMDCVHVV